MIAIFVFYNKSKGSASKIFCGKKYKHCSVLMYQGGKYTLCWSNGSVINIRVLKVKRIEGIIKRIKSDPEVQSIMSVEISKELEQRKWFPLLINSCNEICRLVTGIDVGFTFNPKHLHNKLFLNDGLSNFKIDYYWERDR